MPVVGRHGKIRQFNGSGKVGVLASWVPSVLSRQVHFVCADFRKTMVMRMVKMVATAILAAMKTVTTMVKMINSRLRFHFLFSHRTPAAFGFQATFCMSFNTLCQ
jgi:predicted ABC-type ATPase